MFFHLSHYYHFTYFCVKMSAGKTKISQAILIKEMAPKNKKFSCSLSLRHEMSSDIVWRYLKSYRKVSWNWFLKLLEPHSNVHFLCWGKQKNYLNENINSLSSLFITFHFVLMIKFLIHSSSMVVFISFIGKCDH